MASEWRNRMQSVQSHKQRGNIDGLVWYATKHKNPDSAGSAILALGELGTPAAVDALLALAPELAIDASRRRQIPAALGYAGDPRAIDTLLWFVGNDADWPARMDAAAALAKVRDPARDTEIGAALISALADTERPVADAAAATLCALGDNHGLAWLLDGLQSTDLPAKRRATWALRDHGDERAVEPLRALIEGDPDRGIQEDAQNAVDAILRRAAAPTATHQGARIVDDPTEPFLGSNLAVFVLPTHVLDRERQLLGFPDMCCCCLEPTRRLYRYRTSLELESRSGNVTATTSYLTNWSIPLCEPCHVSGFHRFVEFGQIPRYKAPEGWATFRFPNVAYYRPFAEGNQLLHDEWVAPLDRRFVRRYDPQTGTAALEEALGWWEECHRRIGFHRYVALRERLTSVDDPIGLPAAMAEIGTTLEELQLVERIAHRSFPALRAPSS